MATEKKPYCCRRQSWDPHVSGPPGSESISQSTDPAPDLAPDPVPFLINVLSGPKQCLQNKI